MRIVLSVCDFFVVNIYLLNIFSQCAHSSICFRCRWLFRILLKQSAGLYLEGFYFYFQLNSKQLSFCVILYYFLGRAFQWTLPQRVPFHSRRMPHWLGYILRQSADCLAASFLRNNSCFSAANWILVFFLLNFPSFPCSYLLTFPSLISNRCWTSPSRMIFSLTSKAFIAAIVTS